MNVIAIIQARMGSTRLPGKMTMDIGGKPTIAHVMERAKLAHTLNGVWLATTVDSSDDVLASWAVEHQIKLYRGSIEDVLDRYYQTARLAKADVVARLTGDCPLLDPDVIDKVVSAFVVSASAYDYVSNVHPPTYPDGLDVEVVSITALERAWREATLASEREHVMPYIWEHPEIFRIKNVENDADLSSERWTLDTQEDLEFLRRVTVECKKQSSRCGFADVLKIINAHPEWRAINASYARNEGYTKSLKEDKKVEIKKE